MAGRTISRTDQKRIDRDDRMLRARFQQKQTALRPKSTSTLTNDPSTAKPLSLNQTIETSAGFDIARLIYRIVNTNKENPDARFTVSQLDTRKEIDNGKFDALGEGQSYFMISFKTQQGQIVSFNTSEGTINITFSNIRKETSPQTQATQETAKANSGLVLVSQQTAPETERPKPQTDRRQLDRFNSPPAIKGKKIKVYRLGKTNPIRVGVVTQLDMDTNGYWCIFFQGNRSFTDALQIDRNLEYEVVEETQPPPSPQESPEAASFNPVELQSLRLKLEQGELVGFGFDCRQDYNNAALELLRECKANDTLLTITMKDSPRDLVGKTFTGKVILVDKESVFFHNIQTNTYPTMNLLSEQVTIIQLVRPSEPSPQTEALLSKLESTVRDLRKQG